ncbi:MAG: hypothetical protein C5B59_13570 [Bacteroidetes bacterium]|nr:MAG: hypothetical protein C5B59_13570 [Bacteroidota bacterium]
MIITNAIAHIVQALVTREYNPGLFTALLVFIPSFLWVSKVCFGKGALSRRGIAVLFGTGIILHTILITSIIAYVNDEISRSMLDLIQFLNASTIILIPWLGDKFLNISAK